MLNPYLKNGNNGSRTKKETLLTKFADTGGYLLVFLYKNKKRKTIGIHRLVALHFIPNTENKPDVNHKNGIKIDNRASELEWNTKSENTQNAYIIGLKKQKLSKEQAIEIKQKHITGNCYEDLMKEYSVSRKTIYKILKGITFKYI